MNYANIEDNEDYNTGYNDGCKDAEKELYEEFLSKLTELKQGQTDLDFLIREAGNEIARRM